MRKSCLSFIWSILIGIRPSGTSPATVKKTSYQAGVYTCTLWFLALRMTKNSILALHIVFSLHTHRITLLFCLLQYTSNSFCPSLPLSVHLFCWVVRSWEGLYITSPPPVGQRSGGGEKKKRGREWTGSVSLSLFFFFSAHTHTHSNRLHSSSSSC